MTATLRGLARLAALTVAVVALELHLVDADRALQITRWIR